MFDVRLIALVPPQTTVPKTTAAQNTTTHGANIATTLPVGTLLSGFIINRDAKGNPILRTEKGDVVFSSALFLKIGSEVVLRIQQSGNQQQAHLVSVNNLPPDVAALQSAFAADPEFIVDNNEQPEVRSQKPEANQNAETISKNNLQSTNNLPKAGQTINAILIPTPDKFSNRPQIASGTILTLSVEEEGQKFQKTDNAALAQLTTSSLQKTQNSPASLLELLPDNYSTDKPQTIDEFSKITTDNKTDYKIDYKTPYQETIKTTIAAGNLTNSNRQAADANFRAPLGQNLSASLIAKSPDESASFETSLGILRIANLSSLPYGTKLNLRISGILNPTPNSITIANNAAAPPFAPLSELSHSWQSIKQITSLLDERQIFSFLPTFANHNFPTSEIPAHNSFAASQILFFIAALRGGNFRDWIGNDAANKLEEKGYLSLLRRAEGEFAQIAKQWNDAATSANSSTSANSPNSTSHWQTAFIPIMAGQELQQLRAFIKREKKKSESANQQNNEDTRFILEMELSQLGALQMDGLVKRRKDNLQFDLIIRSHQPLQNNIEQKIQDIYFATAEITGYNGKISFQTSEFFPSHHIEETMPHLSGDFIV